MNLNVIVDLQFKSTFLIKSIALNCNKKGAKSVPFEFGYNDRDPADHPLDHVATFETSSTRWTERRTRP